MKAKFWTGAFGKSKNSTKIPSADLPVFANPQIEITENCSFLHPIIWVQNVKVGNQDYTSVQYCYIEEWKMYYFVTDVVVDKSRVYIHLDFDALASHRDGIFESNGYVLRASEKFNANLVDEFYPTIPDNDFKEEVSLTEPFKLPDDGSYYYLVNYIGEDGVHTLHLSEAQFKKLSQLLWQEWNKASLGENLIRTMGDPFDYIVSVQRTATNATFWQKGQYLKTVKIGVFELTFDVPVREVTGDGFKSVPVKVPKHTQASISPFTKASPYSQYSIYIPCIGWLPLIANDLFDATEVNVDFYGEALTGTMRADVRVDKNIIATGIGKCAIPWGIGSSSISPLSMASGVAQTVISAANKDAPGILAGVQNAVNNLAPTVTYSGGLAGMVVPYDKVKLQLRYQYITPIGVKERGKPYMRYVKLDGLRPGYVVCDHYHYLHGLQPEKETIDGFMNGEGVYLE